MSKAKAVSKVDKTPRKAKRSDLELPGVLSFRRSFEITDGVMCAERMRDGVTETADILIYDQGQRTTKSHEVTKGNGDTQRSGEDSANLIHVQQAKMPQGFDTLVVRTSILVLPLRTEADQCGSDIWHNAIKQSICAAKESSLMERIARYYAYNITNGSWLWRNRITSDAIQIEVKFGDKVVKIKEALDLNPYPVATPDSDETDDPHTACRQIDVLAKAIASTLSGNEKPLRLDVTARVSMMPGQAVWPSQRYTPTKRVVGKQPNGKEIFSSRDFYIFSGAPAITAEKIGSALRTFDNDHGHPVHSSEIIPVEPNGGSLRLGINLRRQGNDLRSLLPGFLGLHNEQSGHSHEALTDSQTIYVLGCLIRGGIFGGSKEDASLQSADKKTDSKE